MDESIHILWRVRVMYVAGVVIGRTLAPVVAESLNRFTDLESQKPLIRDQKSSCT